MSLVKFIPKPIRNSLYRVIQNEVKQSLAEQMVTEETVEPYVELLERKIDEMDAVYARRIDDLTREVETLREKLAEKS